MAISDKITEITNDVKSSYDELNVDSLLEVDKKNTNNLPTAIDNVIEKYKSYIPTSTSTDGVCENAIPLNAKAEVDGNSEQDSTEGYSIFDFYNTSVSKDIDTTYEKLETGFKVTNRSTIDIERIGFSFVVDSSKTYSLDFDYAYTSNPSVASDIGWVGSNKTVTINNISGTIHKSLTGITSGYFSIYCAPNNTLAITNLIVYEGDTQKQYEPYTGGIPSPNPSYPQDIEVVDGCNLFDKDNINLKTGYILNDSGAEIADTSGGYTQNYSKVEENTTYKLYGIYKSTGTRRIYYYDSDKQFISRTTGYTNVDEIEFTTPSKCKYVNIQIYPTHDTDFSAWQLTKGTTSKPYLPYGHIGLRQTGKNLLPNDLLFVYKKRIAPTGDYVSNDNFYGCESYIECSPNKEYIFSTDGVFAYWSGAFYDKDKNFLQYFDVTKGTPAKSPLNTKYCRISYWYNSQQTNPTWWQLEEGTTATSYEPYHEPILHDIDLNGNYIAKVGDIADVLSISNKGEVKKANKINHIASYNGETITTDYMSTTGKLTTGAEVYYVADSETEISLPTTTPIKMWDKTNIFTLVSNLDTDYSITYYIDAQQALLDAEIEI